MADIDLTLYRDRLMSLGSGPVGPIFRYMVTLGARVDARAKRNASGPIVKVRTGNLRASIHTDIRTTAGTIKGVVQADAPYALAVHGGQKPHTIVPRRAGGVLAWRSPGGQPRFARRVQHPGTHARPFLTDALHSEIR
jgi:hypothetical protein